MVSRIRLLLLAAACGAPLVGTTLVLAQTEGPPPAASGPTVPEPARAPLPPPPPPVAPVVPSAELPAPERPTAPTPAMTPRAEPLRPATAELQPESPRRFDTSLDALVRDGIVSPKERIRVRGTLVLDPPPGLRNQACGSGALSAEECRTGVVFRGRGRLEGDGPLRAGESAPGLEGGGWSGAGSGLGGAREGIAAAPLPPISVPVNALLAGVNGRLRLSDVFRLTPRPAPIGGNGNRGLIFPLIGAAVPTSPFGWRQHPILGSWIMHSGNDYAAPEGTPVVAALSGQVVSSGDAGGYGLAVEIEHGKPSRRTLYGHLSEIYVRPGDSVRQGEVIGRVGSTGLSTGPHLHFELRLPQNGGWVAIDPGDLRPGRPSGPFPNLALPGLPGLGPQPATPPDAVAVLFGQLLQTLERPAPAVGSTPLPKAPAAGAAAGASAGQRQAG
ncbi:MAG: M23 family metallopeptidase [Cyanobacteria bacterium K_Offshore_surface_m2_239]|nr:M23 family metallopeptidase [Cyanobacteria bacterium K_Offshore_surface_m2_239]